MNMTAVANIHSPKELLDVGRLMLINLEALFSSDLAFTIMPSLTRLSTCIQKDFLVTRRRSKLTAKQHPKRKPQVTWGVRLL